MAARRVPPAAAAASVLLLLAVAGRYGWHRDELFFLQAGRRPAWGYVDTPPFTPLVARVADELFGASLVGLRLFPALALGAVVLLAAATARAAGGGDRAAAIAAVATATSPLFLGMAHLLSTATFDLLAWTAAVLLVVRLVDGSLRPVGWLAAGAAFGVGLLNKHTVVFLAAALLAGLLATPQRRALGTPWVLGGAAVAVALWLPNVLWHASHDWPVFEMLRSLDDEGGLGASLAFLPSQVAVGPALVLAVAALRRPGNLRFLAVAFALLAALFVVTGGKPYYLAGMYPPLIGIGAARLEGVGAAAAGAMAAVGLAFACVAALPLVPVEYVARVQVVRDLELEMGAQLGWPEQVAAVSRELARLPPRERRTAVVLAGNYGEAAAVDLFGPSLDPPVPPAASPHNQYWLWGPPRDDGAVTVVLGLPASTRARLFGRCEVRLRFRAPHGVAAEENGLVLAVCRDRRKPWDELWPSLRNYAA